VAANKEERTFEPLGLNDLKEMQKYALEELD